jgi:molybdopterin-guanine dinucleotide biosynthesis protein A
MNVAATISGVILCGGEASRMDGVDKPLQLLDGIPLVQHVRRRLAPQVGEIVISANRNHDAYRAIVGNDAILNDLQANQGPLGGIETALGHVATPLLFCCPGDAPFLDEKVVKRLMDGLAMSPASNVAVPYDGDRTQHLFLLLRTSTKDSLENYLRSGNRSVHGFVATCHPTIVDCTDIRESFRNLNTIEELQSANATTTPR